MSVYKKPKKDWSVIVVARALTKILGGIS